VGGAVRRPCHYGVSGGWRGRETVTLRDLATAAGLPTHPVPLPRWGRGGSAACGRGDVLGAFLGVRAGVSGRAKGPAHTRLGRREAQPQDELHSRYPIRTS
jgi:hypothetical protein